MPNTLVNMVNQVLNELGRLAVTTVNDTQDALLISQKLAYLLPEALQWTDWNFAIKFIQDFNPRSEPFSTEYPYAFQLPADFGRFDRFSFQNYNNSLYRFLDGLLLSTTTPVAYYYVVNEVDYAVMTPLFQRVLVLYCASTICTALTQNAALKVDLYKEFIKKQAEAVMQNDRERQVCTMPNDFDRVMYF